MRFEEQVAAWHRDPPEWAKHLKGRDWDVAELIARQLDIAATPEPEACPIATVETRGQWYCTRPKGHSGPCAAVPN